MADDASVLAPNPTPAGIADTPIPPYVAAPNVPNPAAPPADQPMPNNGGASDVLSQPQAQPQPSPAANLASAVEQAATNDPEMVAGAVHQSALAKIMGTVGSILGGSTTVHVTKHPDGSVEVTHDPSTNAEKWSRIAAAALGGAAKGFAAGTGPGGAARAVGAGFDQGVQGRQAQQKQAEHDLDVSQKQMLFSANMAHLNQQIVKGAWDNNHLDRDDLQQQQEISLRHMNEMADSGIQPIMTGVKDPKALAQYGIANPLAVGAHMGQDGAMIYNEPDGKGGVNIYQLSADQGNMRLSTPETVELRSLASDDATKVTKSTMTLPAGQTMKERSAQRMAINVANDNVTKGAATAATAKETADARKKEAENKSATTASENERNFATAQAERSRAGYQDALTDQVQNNKPGGTPQPVNDPRFPPASNFDPGTEGINPMPKTGYKVPADTEKAARLSRNIQHNGQVIVNIMNRRPDLVGTINSLGTNWHQKVVGTKDPDLAALDGAVDQLAIASAGAHGSRSAALIEGIHDGVLNKFKNGPEAVKAYTQGQMNSVQTFLDEENNYRHYGDAVGPSDTARAKAAAKAPAAAPAGGGGGTVPTGATAPATGGQGQPTPPHGAAVRDANGVITPPAGAVKGYDLKTGQLVGYRDANGWHQ